MQKMDSNLASLPMEELRQRWAEQWKIAPHWRIGRQMLVKSLEFKLREARGDGLTAEQRRRLDGLVAAYKRSPKSFDQGPANLKPGTRLVRGHGGVKHVVLVKTDGFEYRSKTYTSLSEIAHAITGTRWNGWVFFGLKKRGGEKP